MPDITLHLLLGQTVDRSVLGRVLNAPGWNAGGPEEGAGALGLSEGGLEAGGLGGGGLPPMTCPGGPGCEKPIMGGICTTIHCQTLRLHCGHYRLLHIHTGMGPKTFGTCHDPAVAM